MQHMASILPMFSLTLNENEINVFYLGSDKDSQPGEKICVIFEDGKWKAYDESNLPVAGLLSDKLDDFLYHRADGQDLDFASKKHYFLLQELSNG